MTRSADLAAVPDSLLDALVERLARRTAELVVADIARRAQTAEPCWLTVAELASSRQLAPCTVRAAIKSGRLAAERWGRTWRIRSDAVIAPPAPGDTPTSRVDELLARPRRRRGAP